MNFYEQWWIDARDKFLEDNPECLICGSNKDVSIKRKEWVRSECFGLTDEEIEKNVDYYFRDDNCATVCDACIYKDSIDFFNRHNLNI